MLLTWTQTPPTKIKDLKQLFLSQSFPQKTPNKWKSVGSITSFYCFFFFSLVWIKPWEQKQTFRKNISPLSLRSSASSFFLCVTSRPCKYCRCVFLFAGRERTRSFRETSLNFVFVWNKGQINFNQTLTLNSLCFLWALNLKSEFIYQHQSVSLHH